MKIKFIEFKDHEFFGDLLVDFCDREGNPYNRIFIVGENGAGKTQLLNTIFEMANDYLFSTQRPSNERKSTQVCLSLNEEDRKIIEVNVGLSEDVHIEEICIDLVKNSEILVKKLNGETTTWSHKNHIKEVEKIISILFLDSNEFKKSPDISPNLSGKGKRFKDSEGWKIQNSVQEGIKRLQIEDDLYLARLVKESPGKIFEKTEFDRTVKKFKNFINSFFSNKQYKGLEKKDFHSSSEIFFQDVKGQVRLEDLSLGEKSIIFQIMFLMENNFSILLIDEPEHKFHPAWQSKIMDAYLSVTDREKVQSIVATHSPYIYKNYLLEKDVGLFILLRNDKHNVEIIDAKKQDQTIFPWSPSWNEINFKAYDLATSDFHNELYGYLQEKTSRYSQNKIEAFLLAEGIKKKKDWISEKNGQIQTSQSVTLQTFIRNKIHHPENRTMQNFSYSQEELKISILEMINLLNTH